MSEIADPWGICQRCGKQRRLRELRREPETRLKVCQFCWDPRHPQEKVRGVPDRQALRNPSPEPEPFYVGLNDVTQGSL